MWAGAWRWPVKCLCQTSILMANDTLQVASIFSSTVNLPTKSNMVPFSCTPQEVTIYFKVSLGWADRDGCPRVLFGGWKMQWTKRWKWEGNLLLKSPKTNSYYWKTQFWKLKIYLLIYGECMIFSTARITVYSQFFKYLRIPKATFNLCLNTESSSNCLVRF